MNLMDSFLFVVAIMLLIPSLTVLIQIVSAAVPKKYTSPSSAKDKVIAVLIPAHNESYGLVATLYSIKAQLQPQDRLLVVADNCSDDTAEVAKNSGAEVIERQDLKNRGKAMPWTLA